MTVWYQCKFQRENFHTVAWIEERGAKVGASVELKTLDGKFWTVMEVYKPGLDEKALRSKQDKDRNAFASIITAIN